MVKLYSRAILVFSTTLAFVSVGCSNVSPPTDRNQQINPVATEAIRTTPPAPSQPVATQTAVNSNPTVADPYQQALDAATSAATISQSAQSTDDWNLVINLWQQAIDLLKAVPATSPYRPLAESKIVEYQQQLSIAQQQAIAPLSPPPAVFTANIKRRISRTPVIEVTFNGTHTFEMIVDSGASSTVITPAMATKIGVRSSDVVMADTASAKGVKFRTGKVETIEIEGAVVNNVKVAIAASHLDAGLLGQDFLSNYDVWIKRDVVEFHPR